MDALAATGRVRVCDIKAHYHGTPVDTVPDAAFHALIAERFPEAVLEDASLEPDVLAALDGARDRLSFDAPIHSLADVDALPVRVRHLNIKPSRFGPLARLFECIDACLERGIELYGGGQFELGVGRGQIQEIASLFYPDTPNDVAPPVYNAPEPVAGLPQSPLVAAAAARRVRLVIAVALAVAALVAAPPRPPIVQRPIPYGPQRRAEMAAYSKRHYGKAEWRLAAPKVIVEHYTVSDTFASAYNTFAPDHARLGVARAAGTCAHFVIDKDGTIYQLVPLGVRCRHTVGLNYTAIGIEHVGRSATGILANARQIAASLALTRWLMARFHIGPRNVIGHAESLSSPYHRELVRAPAHADARRLDGAPR